MAIDLKKMQAKLNSLHNKGGATNFWKPEEGMKHQIRIVPTADQDPFKEYWFHYEIGPKSFLCPKKSSGGQCAVCDFATKLFKDKNEETRKQAKKFLPRQRFFSPIIVRGEENQGIRVWGYGKTAYESMIALVLNPDYGDITDTENGTDLTVESAKNAGQSFPITKLTPARKTSAMCSSPDVCKELLETMPDFDKLNPATSSEEVAKILDEHLSAKDGEPVDEKQVEAESKETVKYGAKEKTGTTKGKKSLDQAFAELNSDE